MKTICANPNDGDVLRDGARLIVSTFAVECPGYAEGLKLFQERLHDGQGPVIRAESA